MSKKGKKVKPAYKPQAPRRFSPTRAKRITGWLMVLGILITLVAINRRQSSLVGIAVVEWLISLAFMLWYWRCPVCGKSLPKTGKVTKCPRCGAEID